jgi:hypothetical protein
MAFVIEKGVKSIASGIGLASEGITHHKQKKRVHEQNLRDNTSSSPTTLNENREDADHLEVADEKQWELDDAQHDLANDHPEDQIASHNEPPAATKQTIEAFLSRYPTPPPSYTGELNRLPFPVVLPQRRPKDKSRGFIRAYAPSLMEVGIDQSMFLDFIETFDKSSQAQPWIQAINLANFATFAMAPPFSFLVSAAIMAATDIATEVHSRVKYFSLAQIC